jgi:hypothetical protein
MSHSALVDLISQAPKTHSEAFWNALNSRVSSDEPLTGELDSKAKAKLVEIFRQSMSSPKPPVTIRIIISFIHKLSQSPRFVENFGRSDPVFTSTFIAFVSRVISKPSDAPFGQLKTDLIVALDALFREPSVLRDETSKGVLASILPILKNVNDAQAPVTIAVAFIHRAIQTIESLMQLVIANVPLLTSAFQSCQSPRLQMQLLRIMWCAQVRTTKLSLIHEPEDNFVEAAHKILASMNNGIGGSILTLKFQSIALPDGQAIEHGWADFGCNELVIYDDESVIVVPFDLINGLNLNGHEALLMELDPQFPGMGVSEKGTEIVFTFQPPLTADEVQIIFAKISRGESQPQGLSEIESEIESELSQASSVRSSQPRAKSSIAVFDARDPQNSHAMVDSTLFAESSHSEPEEDAPPPPVIQDERSPPSSPVIPLPSPPPPMIAQPDETEESTRPPPLQLPAEDDSLLKQHTRQIADKIGSGIDALTRGRMEGVERFGQVMHSAVGSLKEDLRTTMRDREHGSIKQLENSKETFQGNIQQFKRKAASMHQSLLGFEKDARAMTGKITDIQRRVRKEMQQRRIDLENELKKLRNMLRSQNHRGESDDFDDEDISPPLRH